MSPRNRTPWTTARRMRPLGSLAVTLATVLGLTVLVGIPFVPHELRRHERPPASIVQHHPLANGVSLDLIRTASPLAPIPFGWEVVRSEAVSQDESSTHREILFRSVGDPLTSVFDQDQQRLIVASFSGRILSLGGEGEQSPVTIGTMHETGVMQLGLATNQRMLIASNCFQVQGICLTTNRECWTRTDLQTRRVAIDERSGRLLASTHTEGILELDLETGVTLRQIARSESAVIALAISHDGSWLACVNSYFELNRVDRASGQSLWPSARSEAQAGPAPAALAISPDSEFIISPGRSDASVLVVWDAATGTPVRELRGHTAPITGVAFADDGQLHSWGLDGTVRHWRLEIPQDGERVAEARSHVGPATAAERRVRPARQPAAMAAMRLPSG